MRGDQLARQWRIIRAIESSPNGLTVAEIAEREEIGIRTIYRDLEALQAAGFPLYTERVERGNRWAFIDTFKFKIPPFLSRKAAKFAKKKFFNFLPLQNIDLKSQTPFQGRIRILAVLAPSRERFGRFHAPRFQGHAQRALHGKSQNLPRLGPMGRREDLA